MAAAPQGRRVAQEATGKLVIGNATLPVLDRQLGQRHGQEHFDA
jgi:hypothetical protein